jgi:RNA polymerase sigma factor for flagellar operon FliA
MIGLINAIDRFDPERGVRFEAFATSRIRGAVIDQLRSLNWLPRSAVARARHLESTLASLEQGLGRPAREEEVVAELGVTTTRYRQMLLEVSMTMLSLDAPLGPFAYDDEVTTLSDILEDPHTLEPAEQVEQNDLVKSLCSAIKRLPEREKLLLSLYYQEELTMKEISKIVNVSESRVCQLHTLAIMHLRAALQADRSDDTTSFSNPKVVTANTRRAHKSSHTRSTNNQQVIASRNTCSRRKVS